MHAGCRCARTQGPGSAQAGHPPSGCMIAHSVVPVVAGCPCRRRAGRATCRGSRSGARPASRAVWLRCSRCCRAAAPSSGLRLGWQKVPARGRPGQQRQGQAWRLHPHRLGVRKGLLLAWGTHKQGHQQAVTRQGRRTGHLRWFRPGLKALACLRPAAMSMAAAACA